MAQQIINVGVNPNDGTGDPVRTAFGKTNANTTELYTAVGAAEKSVNKGVANGYAGLDGSGKVPSSIVPVATQSALGGVKPDGVTMTASQDGTLAVTGQSVDQLQDASAFTATQINSGYLSIRVAGVDYKITPAALVSAQIKTIDGLPTVSSLSLSDETAVYDVSGSATGKTTFSAIQTLLGTGGGGGGSAPVNTAVPIISGTAQVGQTLAGNHGTWSNSPTGYSYAWKRDDGTTVATTQNYNPVTADIGHTLTFSETASNAAGPSATAATSAATSAVIAASSGGGGSFDKTNGNFQLYYDMRAVTSGTIQNKANPGTGDLTLGGGVSHNAPVSDFTGLVGGGGAGMTCSQTASQISWDANKAKAWVMELYQYDNQGTDGVFSIAGLTGSSGDFGSVQGGNIDITTYQNDNMEVGGYYQDIGINAGLGSYADSIVRIVWVQEDTTNWKAFVAARRAGQAWSAATIRPVQTGTLARPFAIATGAPIKLLNGSNGAVVLGMVGMIAGAITDAQATALMNNPYQPIGGTGS